METKKTAVDLTDLAIGIVVLGIVVAIGATILITMRDAKLTDLDTYSTANETADFSSISSKTLANGWFESIGSVVNTSDGAAIAAGNYSVSIDDFGIATVTNVTNDVPHSWNITYNSYNTSRTDYALADDAATGIGEYGSWFSIIVIVGVAAVILSLIFMAFGKNKGNSGIAY